MAEHDLSLPSQDLAQNSPLGLDVLRSLRVREQSGASSASASADTMPWLPLPLVRVLLFRQLLQLRLLLQ